VVAAGVLVEDETTCTSRIGIVTMIAAAGVSTKDVMDTTTTTKGIAGTEDESAADCGHVKGEARHRGTTTMNSVDTTADATWTESTVILVVLVTGSVLAIVTVMKIVTDMDAVVEWAAISGVVKKEIVTPWQMISTLHTAADTTGTTIPTTHTIVTTATLGVETIAV
jgi:hypothetical protein